MKWAAAYEFEGRVLWDSSVWFPAALTGSLDMVEYICNLDRSLEGIAGVPIHICLEKGFHGDYRTPYSEVLYCQLARWGHVPVLRWLGNHGLTV
mmetsp:Transcript_11383/g.32330  ORF Transcript_11383/g.32330 Transcript_11383/m.32330 type:complete len:94 (-) Transcript_11383:715-996(-)